MYGSTEKRKKREEEKLVNSGLAYLTWSSNSGQNLFNSIKPLLKADFQLQRLDGHLPHSLGCHEGFGPGDACLSFFSDMWVIIKSSGHPSS